ncbi:MAG: ATP synthase subunit g, mitochondrial, partial [Paramarteilia canceri]
NIQRILSNFLVTADIVVFFFFGETIGKQSLVGYKIKGAYDPKITLDDPFFDFSRFFIPRITSNLFEDND